MIKKILENMSEKQKEDVILNYLNSKKENPERKFFEKASFITPILLTLVSAMLMLAVNAADVRSNGLKNKEEIKEVKVIVEKVDEKVEGNREEINNIKVEYSKFVGEIASDIKWLKENYKN